MLSEKSFFNPTLFWKNLSRSWPLWGSVTAVGMLLPLYFILSIISNVTISLDRADFAALLYQASAYFLPAFTACYALLVAMFVWSYLHNTRSVGMMHSLAISRTGLFVTNTLSGLAMLLIPYIPLGIFFTLIGMAYRALDVGALCLTVGAVLLETLLFFGLATFCAMITGNIFAVAGFYIVLNFIVPLADVLISSLLCEFIFGYNITAHDSSMLFSPVLGLYRNVSVNHIAPVVSSSGSSEDQLALGGFGSIVLYGLVGIVLLVAAWQLYRGRRSESAGDIVAFRLLRPVFRFGVAFLSGLTLGRLLYVIFWQSLFQNTLYAQPIPMALCAAIAAVVGYYAASMLLEKSLRVFHGSTRSIAGICVASFAFCLFLALDITGIEKRVPAVEDIASVAVSGSISVSADEERFPMLLEKVVALHQAIVEDTDYIQHFSYPDVIQEDEIGNVYLSVFYTLHNGTHLERTYTVPVLRERLQDSATYDAILRDLLFDRDYLVSEISLPEGTEFRVGSIEGYNQITEEYESYGMSPKEAEVIYDALLQDAREGNFSTNNYLYYRFKGSDREEWDASVSISCFYVYDDGITKNYGNTYYDLIPTMTHTLQALLDTGIVPQENMERWYASDTTTEF